MKGILFTEILFNKTIRKEKTMTRRAPASLKVINENPDDWISVRNVFTWGGFETPEKSGFTEFCFSKKGGGVMTFVKEPEITVKPTYKVGEVVYIKEPTISGVYNEDGDTYLKYKYDFSEEERDGYKWGNKMFMGADKARYYIRITSVKVERLYDISDEDCLKEGVDELLIGNGAVKLKEYPLYDSKNGETTISIRRSFFSLFRFANKVPKSKQIPNLWVFCYSYCLCDKEGNEL